jgi:hypothetical protein
MKSPPYHEYILIKIYLKNKTGRNLRMLAGDSKQVALLYAHTSRSTILFCYSFSTNGEKPNKCSYHF